MSKSTVELSEEMVSMLSRYWPGKEFFIASLPVCSKIPSVPIEDIVYHLIDIPEWGSMATVNGKLLVPVIKNKKYPEWSEVNWLWVMHWYLDNIPERAFEEKNGPVHSYSFRLINWNVDIWQHAWVNRIAIFLREWAAHLHQTTSYELFGPLPRAEIIITYDLDAVSKTKAIRFKQSFFFFFNSGKALIRFRLVNALKKFIKGFRFLFGNQSYWNFDKLINSTKDCNSPKRVHVFAKDQKKKNSFIERIIDPSYDIQDKEVNKALKELSANGFQIGIHPGYHSWNDKDRLEREISILEETLEFPIIYSRQHWLRFSFADTWQVQKINGIAEDSTLGFNDRSGFRNSAALSFRPLFKKENGWERSDITVKPLILMDSHLFDYSDLTRAQKEQKIDMLLDEVIQVGGQATVLWHPHTLGEDYGWGEMYAYLINRIKNIA